MNGAASFRAFNAEEANRVLGESKQSKLSMHAIAFTGGKAETV